ncbi:MAG: hypothetical protein PHR60_06135 [Eubacteriales bacterium]|nr:hypothetical protein [Eubacteriales bacterium]MDD4583753.1 hypothetical protein [Eubacteriales bacterium]
MKHKGIYLVFLLILALLMFSGCARYDRTYTPDGTNYVTDNGTNGKQGVTDNTGTQNNNPNRNMNNGLNQ